MTNLIRDIDAATITKAVYELFIEANTCLGDDVRASLEQALLKEASAIGRDVLSKILDNARIARQEALPICQDTGLAVVFVELGQDVRITGGDLRAAVEEGVRRAYEAGCLRKSVCDPLSRENTQDNTPAVIHFNIIPGNSLAITAMPKGGGSENMSRAAMLTPSAGMEGIKKFVLDTVSLAGANPCPPIIVGLGIGGSLEAACLLAKKALLRPVGTPHPTDQRLAGLEKELEEAINTLGIGPGGLGGQVTALAVHADIMPCHIASLPVAVNIQCHVARHVRKIL